MTYKTYPPKGVNKPVALLSVLLITGALLASELTVAQRQSRPRELTQPDSQGSQQANLPRVALVIGNANYAIKPLANPVNDARDMYSTLQSLGFDVVYGEDLTLEGMKRKVTEFGRKLANGNNVGLFYYAGHGVQVNGKNYLIPVDLRTLREHSIEYEALDVGSVVAEMLDSNKGIDIVILDACRSNPFAMTWRGASDGLAPISPPADGMLIAYATLPNKVADDGLGRNGLFTSELLKQIRTPGVDIEEVFRRVRERVKAVTGGAQVPSLETTFTGSFFFSNRPPATGSPSLGSTPAQVLSRLVPVGANLSASAIRSFPFSTVTVDSRGVTTNPKQGQVNGYVEYVNGVSLDMVEIPGGTFLMGTGINEREFVTQEYQRNISSPTDTYQERAEAHERAAGWVAKEMPQHFVRVQGFYMGRYEVTQAQWRAVSRLPKVHMELNPDPSSNKGDSLPVEQVSWDEAVEFCARLSRATGREYRLPSEAEWEYAARAGSATQFPLGDNITSDLVNFWGESPWGGAPEGRARRKTTPVGSLAVANGFGLYDVSGNVWEWCQDYWHERYEGAPSDGRAWLSGGMTKYRVVRGCSWYDAASYCRSASRGRNPQGQPATDRYGFRIVATAR